jgi:predicted thioesterase
MPVKLEKISAGLSASTEIVVGTRDTAHHVGSGKVKVLATPVMVTLLEEAALIAVEGLLPEGHQSVGTLLNVSHIAATPVGSRVIAHAEVTEVNGRVIKFNVRAEDEHELIGSGAHERMVVDVSRFDERVQKKSRR